MKTYLKQTGFTIVELLIVIVVIAVLAAISIVAYNGIQERASSVSITSRAGSYIKGLKVWEADIGRTTMLSSCIAPSSYTTCAAAYGWGSNVPNDNSFNSNLAKYSGVAQPVLGNYGPNTPTGLMYFYVNFYGANRDILAYSVGPNTDCGLPNVLSTPYNNMTLSGAKFTERSSSWTYCVIEVFKY